MAKIPLSATSEPFKVLRSSAYNNYKPFDFGTKKNKNRLCDGFLTYGIADDYPQLVENIINSSSIAKAAATKLADFISGDGFFDSALNEIIINSDIFDRPVTLVRLLKETALQLSYFAGVYWRIDRELGDVSKVTTLDFKTCRLGLTDDLNKIHSVLQRKINASGDRVEIDYHVFTQNEEVVKSRFIKDGNKSIPEVYCGFYDYSKIYPVAFIEPAIFSADSDHYLGFHFNSEIRNGLSKLTFIHYPRTISVIDANGNENKLTDNDETKNTIESMVGPGGAKVAAIGCDVGADGIIIPAIDIKEVDSNMNLEIAKELPREIMRNICLVNFNIPEILVKSQDGSLLSGDSADTLKTQYEIYNQNTADLRKFLSDMFRDVFKFHVNSTLRSTTDWTIKEKSLNTGLKIG